MTDEEQASQPGAVATRSDEGAEASAAGQVFTPKDFKLNLGARPAPDDEPLPNLDNPAIRKLTWEHVVPDRPASSTPSAATTVPLPPPSRVPPPSPLAPATSLQPPVHVVSPEPIDAPDDIEVEVVEDFVDEELAVEDQLAVDAEIEVDTDLDPDFDDVDVDDRSGDLGVDEVAAPAVASPQPEAPAPKPVVAEVEVNRLSSVPDLIDDDSPIELPPITPSGPIVASPQNAYSPVLAETLYVPPPQRPPTMTVPITAADRKPHRRKHNRKQKRHLFRTFVTLVVLFGLLAGGAFAAKKYLLHKPTWSAELKPLADGVATQRGLQFKLSIEVTEVPVAEYAKRLASTTIDGTTDHAPAWRALGLLNGEFDLEAIGRQALNDSPAFYDPATKTIVVSDDLKSFEHLYRFALRRALATALLDQQFDWSSRLSATSPAAALGLRATIDGDALAVANALAVQDAPDQLAPEFFAFVQAHGSTISPSQYAATITGRPGVMMRPTIESLANDPVGLATLEQATPSNDAVLDAGRLPSAVVSPPATQGMMFWYYVLASRIDDGQAWAAAARWSADSLTNSTAAPTSCVDATFSAADADGAAVVLAALQAWTAAAPLESTTSVTPVDGTQIAVHACDPGAVLTAALPARVPVIFGGAGVERALVQSAVSAAGRNSTVDRTCLVTAARARGAVFASPADDAPVLAVGWQPPYVAANTDLAAGCVRTGG